MAIRYRGRIHEYEIWNEPNLKPFFTGSTQELVQLSRVAYETLREVDSSLVVVSPAATGGESGIAWLDRYLSLGGGAYCDVIGFHLYTGGRPPESMLDVCAKLSAVLAKHGLAGKQVWNTETGWQIPDVPVPGKMARADSIRQGTLAAYVSRALILGWWGGMSRFYWYAWDNYKFGLVNADGVTEKPAAMAYRLTREWLVGKKMEACRDDTSGVWSVRLRSVSGDVSWIYWSVRGTRFMNLDSLEPGFVVTDLQGRAFPLASLLEDGKVEVGMSPILVSMVHSN